DGDEDAAGHHAPDADRTIEGQRKRETTDERRGAPDVLRSLAEHRVAERARDCEPPSPAHDEAPGAQCEVARVVEAKEKQHDEPRAGAESEGGESDDGAEGQPARPYQSVADASE